MTRTFLKRLSILVIYIGSALLVIALVFTVENSRANIAGLNNQLTENSKSSDTKIAALQKQIAVLEKSLSKITGENQQVALSLKEIENRQTIREKSQEELVTAAVAKVTPSVVSIVISKNMPQYEVVYQNPFGNDPFFGGFNLKVPALRQKGTATQKQKVGAGTGFVITADGYILTNKHVVSDSQASYTVLLSNGTRQEAQVVYRDPTHDIAVIKINGINFKPASFGDSGNIKLGQTVIAIGNALGEYNNSVSVGIISGLNRTIEVSDAQGSSETLSGVIQTDAAVNPGNSGGPLVNTDGAVVGVNVATVTGTNNISFSIPADSIKPILQSVLKKNF